MAGRLAVTLKRSTVGTNPGARATVRALGLRRIGQTVELPDDQAVRGQIRAVRYLVEVHGLDVNARDHDGYTPLHHAASRGDMEVIRYLIERGADPTAVSRSGQSTADMANGPVQRIQPFPEARDYLVSLGAKNNDRCRSC